MPSSRLPIRLPCVLFYFLGSVSCFMMSTPQEQTTEEFNAQFGKFDRAFGQLMLVIQNLEGLLNPETRVGGSSISQPELPHSDQVQPELRSDTPCNQDSGVQSNLDRPKPQDVGVQCTLTSNQPLYSESIFSKIEHPLTAFLKTAAVYSVNSIDEVMKFLRFLVEFSDCVTSNGISPSQALKLLVPHTIGTLRLDLVQASAEAVTLNEFHQGTLDRYLPSRARSALIQSYLLRVQRMNESLRDYIEDVFMYHRVLLAAVPASMLVESIVEGISPEYRSYLTFSSRPETVMDLKELAIRAESVKFADASRIINTPPPIASGNRPVTQALPSSRLRCYNCGSPQHLRNRCPESSRKSSASRLGR